MKKILLLQICFILTSCFTEPKKNSNDSQSFENTNNENKYINDNSSTYNESLQTQKKFGFIIIEISKPVLTGTKSDFQYDIPSSCNIVYETEYNHTDIIELNDYNEDVKYRLLDEAEKLLLDKYKYINSNLYSDAVITYGNDAAEHIRNENHTIKIINRDILVFDSYAEASKKRNE